MAFAPNPDEAIIHYQGSLAGAGALQHRYSALLDIAMQSGKRV